MSEALLQRLSPDPGPKPDLATIPSLETYQSVDIKPPSPDGEPSTEREEELSVARKTDLAQEDNVVIAVHEVDKIFDRIEDDGGIVIPDVRAPALIQELVSNWVPDEAPSE